MCRSQPIASSTLTANTRRSLRCTRSSNALPATAPARAGMAARQREPARRQDADRHQRNQRQDRKRRRESGVVDRESGDERPQQARNRIAQRQQAEVVDAGGGVAEFAGRVLRGDLEHHERHADERRAGEEREQSGNEHRNQRARAPGRANPRASAGARRRDRKRVPRQPRTASAGTHTARPARRPPPSNGPSLIACSVTVTRLPVRTTWLAIPSAISAKSVGLRTRRFKAPAARCATRRRRADRLCRSCSRDARPCQNSNASGTTR